MELTLLGYIVIPISLILFFIKGQNLLYLTIIFSIFTASSIVNITSSKTGIQPVYFVGTLWLLFVLLRNIKRLLNKEISLKDIIFGNNKNFARSNMIFLIVNLLSLTMPILFNGKINIAPLSGGDLVPLHFKSQNLTQYVYFVFMILIAISILIEVNEEVVFINCLKAFIFSTFFASIWGIIQFCMFYLKIQYPSFLFNNNIAYSQQFNQMIYGIKRVNSVAIEPSMFALNLLMVLPLVFMIWMGNYKLVKNKNINVILNSCMLLIVFFVIILTTSTTAYIALFLFIIAIVFHILFFTNKNTSKVYKKKYKLFVLMISMFLSVIMMIILCVFIFKMDWKTLVDTFKDITINKKNLVSASERSMAISNSLNVFYNSPLLGAGWGSHRSLDLVTNLLANCGVLGLMSFSYVIITSIINVIKLIKGKKINEFIGIGILFSIVLGVFCLAISIPDISFVYFWVILAIANAHIVRSNRAGA